MLRILRNSLCSKILWGVLGLYLLNISVDAPDPNPEFIAEDLSLNDQESIVEIIVEKILGFENAIAEYDDHDTDSQTGKKNIQTDWLNQFHDSPTNNYTLLSFSKDDFPNYAASLTYAFLEIDSPPPKV